MNKSIFFFIFAISHEQLEITDAHSNLRTTLKYKSGLRSGNATDTRNIPSDRRARNDRRIHRALTRRENFPPVLIEFRPIRFPGGAFARYYFFCLFSSGERGATEDETHARATRFHLIRD